MTDIKVYIINYELHRNADKLSDSEFMDLAKNSGEVYSLKEFERVWNSEEDTFDSDF